MNRLGGYPYFLPVEQYAALTIYIDVMIVLLIDWPFFLRIFALPAAVICSYHNPLHAVRSGNPLL
ncbi:hypothetical protein D3C81_2139940 [compost metagenome]